ncbi:MAG: hypothetical protein OYG31_01550 [Candidatus Kaiserbacteria bacterium]|nr:hypothetical protein [Candidatus Kaiserbacteria bacterium]
MHQTVDRIRALLDDRGISYKYMEHDSGVTSEDMVRIRKDYSLSEGAKALILKTDGGFVQVVVPGDKKFQNKKLRSAAGVRQVRFATPDELATITDGILPGAVPPFGNLFDLPVYADTTLFTNNRIVFNCGDRCASIAMSPEDYRSVVRPTVVDLSG